MTIALQLGKINATLTHKLLEILDGNNGDTELFLEVHDPESSSNISLKSKKIHINPTNSLINELEILEKEGSIEFWINNNKNSKIEKEE